MARTKSVAFWSSRVGQFGSTAGISTRVDSMQHHDSMNHLPAFLFVVIQATVVRSSTYKDDGQGS